LSVPGLSSCHRGGIGNRDTSPLDSHRREEGGGGENELPVRGEKIKSGESLRLLRRMDMKNCSRAEVRFPGRGGKRKKIKGSLLKHRGNDEKRIFDRP